MRQHRQRGFTFLTLLFIIAIMGVVLAAAGQVWYTARQRDNERELLFVGDQFRGAIESYYVSSPGGSKQYPKRLEDLLEDKRFPGIKRHLRRIYRDPMTGRAEWGLMEVEDKGITGVYSLSNQAPLKMRGFSPPYEDFADRGKYSEWKFAYAPKSDNDAPSAPSPESPAFPGPRPQ